MLERSELCGAHIGKRCACTSSGEGHAQSQRRRRGRQSGELLRHVAKASGNLNGSDAHTMRCQSTVVQQRGQVPRVRARARRV